MKNFNKIMLAVVSLICFQGVKAQQFPMYNMQFMNQSLYNPATVGLDGKINAMLVQKSYLTGIDGNPNTLYVSLDAPAIENKLGVGLNIYNDNMGVSNKLGVYGSSAYRFKFQQDHFLDFGLSLGMLQFSIDPDEINVENENDPLLTNRNYKSSTIDGMFGVNYTFRELTFGVGVNQIFENSNNLEDNTNYNLQRNFIGSLKYTLFFNSKRDFSLSPMIIARYANTNVPQEAFLIANYKDMFYLAPSYKSTGALGVSIAANVFNGIKVGYSYETIINDNVGQYQNGGHEIMVGYSFDTRSNSQRKIDAKLRKLDNELDNFEKRQELKDKEQDDKLRDQNKEINKNKRDIDDNKQDIDQLDKEIQKTQKELEDLKQELRDAGILKEENASDFDNTEKGYYIVIASVKQKNISEDRMKSDYLDRGFNRMYNKTSGWHYVYKSRYNDFSKALKDLRETRKGEFNDAWIHVLK